LSITLFKTIVCYFSGVTHMVAGHHHRSRLSVKVKP
jgi:hypothetical protein